MRWRRLKHHVNLFSLISVLTGLLIVVPMLNILFEIMNPGNETWLHIREHLLMGYVINTLILIGLVAVFSALIGFLSAYVVTRFEFKGRALLSWMLILPLAIPSYIAAYVYADMLSYTGTFSRALRSLHVSHDFNIMSMSGAVFIFVMTLYPYVYMMVRSALSKQSAAFIENARLLGAGKFRQFFQVVLPLVRPALVAGTLLVVLETLNDYGVVAYFNVRVFSFAIFDAWERLGDVGAAIRLSAVLMVIVFVVIFLERFLRGRRRYHLHVKGRPIQRKTLKGINRFILPGALWLMMLLGFFIPLFQLLYYARLTYRTVLNISFVYLTINTLSLAITATLIIIALATILANFNRGNQTAFKKSLLKITNLGYAIPGAVIAIAVLVFFIDIDHRLYPLYRLFNENTARLVLTSTLSMLVFAYVLRFMAIGYNAIEAAYDKVGEKFTEASYSLGHSKLSTLFRIDVPLIKGGLISAAIIVFIDVIKELPLTLILRPTNYDTLATQVFRYAREEMLQETAVPSLMIILIATLLIYGLTHQKKKDVRFHVRRD